MLKSHTISQQSAQMHAAQSVLSIVEPSSGAPSVETHETLAPSDNALDPINPLSTPYPHLERELLGLDTIASSSLDTSSTHRIPSLHPHSGLVEENTFHFAEERQASDLEQERETLSGPLEDLHADDLVDNDENPHTHSFPFISEPGEDDPDPFVNHHRAGFYLPNIEDTPDHLVVIHAMVCWLHLQFFVPRIACNAVLAILVCLLAFLSPNVPRPFTTLQSATRALGVDAHIELLPVCPNCWDVFPSASSKHARESCPVCAVPLFLSDRTNRGNHRAKKNPVIKYPYLSLSDQIESFLKVPGVEALLDEWRIKSRHPGEYNDIFDGDMCRRLLKAPDGSTFFSNLPHEQNGPNGELRIGVNLGVDW